MVLFLLHCTRRLSWQKLCNYVCMLSAHLTMVERLSLHYPWHCFPIFTIIHRCKIAVDNDKRGCNYTRIGHCLEISSHGDTFGRYGISLATTVEADGKEHRVRKFVKNINTWPRELPSRLRDHSRGPLQFVVTRGTAEMVEERSYTLSVLFYLSFVVCMCNCHGFWWKKNTCPWKVGRHTLGKGSQSKILNCDCARKSRTNQECAGAGNNIFTWPLGRLCRL